MFQYPPKAQRFFGCLFFGLLTLLFFFKSPASAQAPGASVLTPESIQRASDAAHEDFPNFLRAALQRPADYGFMPGDDDSNVRLASPLFIYNLAADSTNSVAADGSNLLSVIEPAGEWIFPVSVGNDDYRTLFGVRLHGQVWKAAYLGNSYLAKQIQGLRAAWRKDGIDRFKLVSCVNPRAFFFIVEDAPLPNLTPLTPLVFGPNQKLMPPSDWQEITPASISVGFLKALWSQGAADQP